jgi:hypothetical protein
MLLQHIVNMIFYEKNVEKAIRKNEMARKIIEMLHHAFQALDLTGDL